MEPDTVAKKGSLPMFSIASENNQVFINTILPEGEAAGSLMLFTSKSIPQNLRYI